MRRTLRTTALLQAGHSRRRPEPVGRPLRSAFGSTRRPRRGAFIWPRRAAAAACQGAARLPARGAAESISAAVLAARQDGRGVAVERVDPAAPVAQGLGVVARRRLGGSKDEAVGRARRLWRVHLRDDRLK